MGGARREAANHRHLDDHARSSSARSSASGIFMLPVSARAARPQCLIGWVVSGVGVLVHRLCAWPGCRSWAATASRPISNGEFGPTVALPRRLGASGCPTGSRRRPSRSAAASALSFDRTAIRRTDVAIVIAASSGSSLLTCVNAIGVRAAGGFSLVTVAIKLLPLLAVDLAVRAARRQRRRVRAAAARCRSRVANDRGGDGADLFRLDRL